MRPGGNWIVGVALLGLAMRGAAQDCAPVWQEEFDSPVDDGVWTIYEGDGCELGLCGFGNNEEQVYDARSIDVSEGRLSITASVTESGQILSGKMTTEGRFAHQYGRFEARMKLPEGRGLWPAFWMMPENQSQPWPREGEIDILEWTGNQPHRVIGAIHFGEPAPDNVHYSETLLTPTVWSGHYHVFGIEWSPDSIRWTVDGQVHGEATPEKIAPWNWVFNDSQYYLIVNMAVGGNLGGKVKREDLPATLEVDWIRVFDQDCRQL